MLLSVLLKSLRKISSGYTWNWLSLGFRVEEGRLNPYARLALVKLVRKFTGIPTKACLRSPMVIFLA